MMCAIDCHACGHDPQVICKGSVRSVLHITFRHAACAQRPTCGHLVHALHAFCFSHPCGSLTASHTRLVSVPGGLGRPAYSAAVPSTKPGSITATPAITAEDKPRTQHVSLPPPRYTMIPILCFFPSSYSSFNSDTCQQYCFGWGRRILHVVQSKAHIMYPLWIPFEILHDLTSVGLTNIYRHNVHVISCKIAEVHGIYMYGIGQPETLAEPAAKKVPWHYN
eukprot:1063066-Pelagomonas_calceolata.AAC.3